MKIKYLILLLLMMIFFPMYAFDETFLLVDKKTNGVKNIVEKTFDKWETISYFDENGFLLQQLNYFNSQKRSDYRYEYIVLDTLLNIKKTIVNGNQEEYFIDKYYYSPTGLCYKYEMYSSLQELNIPYLTKTDFIFTSGLIQSYNGSGMYRIPYKVMYTYNEKYEKTKTCEVNISQPNDTIYSIFKYNQRGQLTDYIVESNNNETIFSDVICWSNSATNKFHIRYTNFDAYGNWTKSYFITKKGKKFRSKRKIEYW